jgi:hypothetical protein
MNKQHVIHRFCLLMGFNKINLLRCIFVAKVAFLCFTTPVVAQVNIEPPQSTSGRPAVCSPGWIETSTKGVCVPASTELQPGRGFRGKITYKGTYSLSEFIPTREQDRTTIQIGNARIPVGSAARTETSNGAITIFVEFDGSAFSARQVVTGLLRNASFSGVVRNGICETTAVIGNLYSRSVGQCDTAVFNVTGSTSSNGVQLNAAVYNLQAVEVIDYDIRDAKRAEQATAAQAQQERARAEQVKADARAKVEKDTDTARQESLLRSLPPVRVNK